MVRALLITKENDAHSVTVAQITDDDLPAGDVLVDVAYSTINFKDSLAITNKAPIIRQFPMVPGIDLAGTVIESRSDRFKPGDKVVLNGWGVGERHFGGLAERARVSADWLLKLPATLTEYQAMAIGTAGYTAMLCIMALEAHDVTPQSGPILVTGATGGVGVFALGLLKRLGYSTIASTGKASEAEFLKSAGADEVIDRNELSEPGRPLGKERWAGAVDSVGGHTLANVCASTSYGGCVAACGLAQSMDFPATVTPFILRGVTLAGIDSVMAPRPKREAAWARLAQLVDDDLLAGLTTTIGLDEVVDYAQNQMAGKIKGRAVVDVKA